LCSDYQWRLSAGSIQNQLTESAPATASETETEHGELRTNLSPFVLFATFVVNFLLLSNQVSTVLWKQFSSRNRT
jgi:hypothetical protein